MKQILDENHVKRGEAGHMTKIAKKNKLSQKNTLSLDLKEAICHINGAIWEVFQSSGEETVKAQDPKDFRLKLTGFRCSLEDDRRVHFHCEFF